MCAEDFGNVSPRRAHTYPRVGYALAYIPVTAVKSRGPPIERVGRHAALLDRPSRQNDESTTEDAAMVELAIGQKMTCPVPYGIVVSLRPALLQPHNVWRLLGRGDLVPNLVQALVAELGDVLQAPAIERENAQRRGRTACVGSHEGRPWRFVHVGRG